MDSLIDLSDPSQALDLESIRFQLIRLEDTITFHLIERAQFPLNKTIYIPGALNIPNSGLSLMDWYLREQESLQSMIRRYEAPDEFPFFPAALRKPILKPLNYPPVLHQHNINVNDKILPYYVDRFLPAVCPKFDREDRGESEENYGSAATCDILCLQAISRRIHFGNYVAESKFRSDPEKYTQLIRDKDEAGIYMSITNNAVEKKLLERIRLKVLTYGREPSAQGTASPAKINVDAVVEGYRDFIIPLTKEVEIAYLMQRLEPRD